jgi:hypothetical protein
MGAPRFMQECSCGHSEAAGRFCSRCLRITQPDDIRRQRKYERLPRPGSRASKELRRDPGVPQVREAGVSRPLALSGTLLEAA